MGVACGGGDLVLPEEQPPVSLEALHGDGQSAPPGEELAQPIVVKVTDAEGRPLADLHVAFSLGAGAAGGATNPDTARTNQSGEASARWVLGSGLGEQRVDAEVVGAGLAVVSFTATAVEDARQPSAERSSVTASPATIEAVTGFSVIRVVVLDDRGDPVSGATVTLAAAGVGNALTQPSEPTGDDGVAAGTLQAITPGTRVVSAVVNGVTILETASVEVVLTPVAQRLAFLVQPSDTEEDETMSPAVAVAVVDDDGDVVPLDGVEIRLELIREKDHGSNELEGTTAQLTDDGVAVFSDLRVDRGDRDYRLHATAPGRPELGSVDSETFDIED
ncbi:MAG TPA: invasin domain 3-containing protein [Gemmatimonadales bacterium]